MNNLQELKQIIADAPEGRIDDITFDITGRYFDKFGNLLNSKGVWALNDDNPLLPRSLSDLRTIVEQAERIAELELWIEYAVKHDLQMPEWVRNSAACLLNKQIKGGDL